MTENKQKKNVSQGVRRKFQNSVYIYDTMYIQQEATTTHFFVVFAMAASGGGVAFASLQHKNDIGPTKHREQQGMAKAVQLRRIAANNHHAHQKTVHGGGGVVWGDIYIYIVCQQRATKGEDTHLEDGVGQDDDSAHGVGAENLRENGDDLLHDRGVDQREDGSLRPVGHEPTDCHLSWRAQEKKTKRQEKKMEGQQTKMTQREENNTYMRGPVIAMLPPYNTTIPYTR